MRIDLATKLLLPTLMVLMAITSRGLLAQCPQVQVIDLTSAGAPSSYCLDEVRSFEQQQTAPGMTYFWYVNGGTLVSPNGNPTMDVLWDTPGPNHYLELTITGGNCYDWAGYTVGVWEQIAPPVSGPTAVCDNDSGMYTVYWYRGIGLGPAYDGNMHTNGTVYAASRNFLVNNWVEDTLWIDWSTVPFGTQKAVWFNYWHATLQCIGTDTLYVGSNSLAEPDLGPDFSFCALGDTFDLDPGSGFNSYLWNTAAATPQISVTNPGTYAVTTTDSNGCIDMDTIVLSLQPPNAALGPDQSVCQGSAATLNPGSGYTSYLWSDNSTGQTLTTALPGTYSVTVTDPAACTDADTIEIFNLPLPVVNLGPDQTVCYGTSVTLNAGPGFSYYLWSTGYIIQTITPTYPGTYHVTVTDSNGCISRDTAVISNFTYQFATIGPNQTVCPGAVATFDAGPGWNAYLWSDNSTGQSLGTSVPGTYSVTVTDTNGCPSSASATLANYNTATVSIGPNQTVCPGAVATFDAGPGWNAYLWSDNSTGQSLGTSAPGTYSVTVTDANGCPVSASASLANHAVPTINMGPNLTVCPGASATFNAGPGFTTYLWSNGDTNQSISVTQPGTYSVTATTANNCTASASAQLLNFTLPALSLGADTSICPDTTLQLDAGPGFSAYLWSDNSTGQTLQAAGSAIYWVEVTDANSCVWRDSIQVGQITDCIWPGDADHDGLANNADMLAIGVAFGAAGPTRPAASQSWYGQVAPDWSLSFPGPVNYKHADCNGDGTVDNADTLAVFNNYGLSHNRVGGAGAGTPLYLLADQDTVLGSSLTSVGLYLGDAQTPADSAYGLALSLNFVPGQVDLNSVWVSYPTSFLGTKGQDLLTLTKPFLSAGTIDLALVRNDQVDRSGMGRIATIHFRADSNYWQGQLYQPIEMDISGALFISGDYTFLDVGVQGDTFIVANPVTGLSIARDRAFRVYPNPSSQAFTVELATGIGEVAQLSLCDLAGRVVHSQALEGNSDLVREQVSVADLPAGVYFLEVGIGKEKMVRKVMVNRN